MNIKPIYSAEFFRGEIERLTLYMTQAISDEQRAQYQEQLKSAREHLADIEKQDGHSKNRG